MIETIFLFLIIFATFRSRALWFTVSKAAIRSTKTVPVVCFPLYLSPIYRVRFRSWPHVERPGLSEFFFHYGCNAGHDHTFIQLV